MSKRKYERGKRIESIDEIVNSTENWYEVVRPNGYRMWHAGALLSLQTKVLSDWVKAGFVYKANRVQKKVRLIPMMIENGVIVEATEAELYAYYLDYDWWHIMPFCEFREKMENCGVIVTDKEAGQWGGSEQ